MRVLLSCGAEVDREDSRGRTPLFLSVSGQHLEAARSLLEAGARLDKEDQEGNSIWKLARKPDLLDLVAEFSSNIGSGAGALDQTPSLNQIIKYM